MTAEPSAVTGAPASKRKKKKRRKKRYLLKLTILILAGVGIYHFLASSFFDITAITVENNSYYTPEIIIEKAGLQIGENLFKIRTGDVKKRLLKDPYIKSVLVRRVPPGGVHIAVEERSEAAAVPLDDSWILIDEDGLVLRTTEVEPTLTVLAGMNLIRAEDGKPLEVEENPVLADTLGLLKEIKNHDLYFKRIDISSIIIRAYVYDQLVCEGTPENFQKNLDALKQVLVKLDEQGIQRGTVRVGGDNYVSWQAVVE